MKHFQQIPDKLVRSSLFKYQIVALLKKWIKFSKETILVNLRIGFLRDCKDHGFYAAHLNRNDFFKIKFYCYKYKRRALNNINKHIDALLKLEIADDFKYRRTLYYRLCHLEKKLINHLPLNICNRFFSTQYKIFHRFLKNKSRRLNKKFLWLQKSNGYDKKKIKDITYYVVDNIAETKLPDVVSSNSHKKFQFQEPKNNNINNETIKVNLSACQFKHISYDIFEVNDKW